MGWVRTLLLGDIGNRLDIADTEREIESIKSDLNAARDLRYSQRKEVLQLQRENESLELCLATLIRVLESKGVLTHEEVEKLVAKSDPKGGATRVGEA
jgi:hypothetical protein